MTIICESCLRVIKTQEPFDDSSDYVPCVQSSCKFNEPIKMKEPARKEELPLDEEL